MMNHFAARGYCCPPHCNPADFILDTTSIDVSHFICWLVGWLVALLVGCSVAYFCCVFSYFLLGFVVCCLLFVVWSVCSVAVRSWRRQAGRDCRR